MCFAFLKSFFLFVFLLVCSHNINIHDEGYTAYFGMRKISTKKYTILIPLVTVSQSVLRGKKARQINMFLSFSNNCLCPAWYIQSLGKFLPFFFWSAFQRPHHRLIYYGNKNLAWTSQERRVCEISDVPGDLQQALSHRYLVQLGPTMPQQCNFLKNKYNLNWSNFKNVWWLCCLAGWWDQTTLKNVTCRREDGKFVD